MDLYSKMAFYSMLITFGVSSDFPHEFAGKGNLLVHVLNVLD